MRSLPFELRRVSLVFRMLPLQKYSHSGSGPVLPLQLLPGTSPSQRPMRIFLSLGHPSRQQGLHTPVPTFHLLLRLPLLLLMSKRSELTLRMSGQLLHPFSMMIYCIEHTLIVIKRSSSHDHILKSKYILFYIDSSFHPDNYHCLLGRWS